VLQRTLQRNGYTTIFVPSSFHLGRSRSPLRLLVTFRDQGERRKVRIIEGSGIEGNRVRSVWESHRCMVF